MESAGITLLKGDLSAIVRARRLSRAVMRNIKENCSSHLSTTRWEYRLRRAFCIPSSAFC